MGNSQNSSPAEQAKKMVLVILTGFAAGIVAVYGMVHFWSPSGNYTVDQVMIKPHVLSEIWYSDKNPKTGGMSKFIFKDITFQAENEKKQTVSLVTYEAIYNLLKNDVSIGSAANLFLQPSGAVMKIHVTTESDASWQQVEKVVQQIEFASDGSHYRVYLREDNPGENWAYFNHDQVLSEVSSKVKE